jgi:hypothetical protein
MLAVQPDDSKAKAGPEQQRQDRSKECLIRWRDDPSLRRGLETTTFQPVRRLPA